MFFNKNVFFLTLLCLLPFNRAYSETDPCSSLADLTSKTDANVFVGYSAGMTQAQADENARVELARNIRQSVSATSKVSESNNEVTLNNNSKSAVDEVLIDTKVLRRCPQKDSFSTVITLNKTSFLNAVSAKLTYNIEKISALKKSLEQAKSDEQISQNVENSKKYLNDYQALLERDLEVCKTYKGCTDLKLNPPLEDLINLVAKYADKDQYILITSGKNKDYSATLRTDLIKLLASENIKVMDDTVSETSSTVTRKIIAKCNAKKGSKIPGSDNFVVETVCTVEGYIAKQKKFHKTYSCSAMGDKTISEEDAVNSCSGRLQIQ